MILRYYTIADLAILQQYLADAYAARALLSSGGRIASVSYEGKSVSYTSGNIADLYGWINDLNETIGWLTGARVARRGPIHLTF